MMHLSEYMASNNLDDAAVAAGINRSRVTVSRIRRRKVRPDWPTIERIKEFTNGACTADDFQALDGSPSSSPEAA
jgi:hypothetical protein